jgi:hypothetical protein
MAYGTLLPAPRRATWNVLPSAASFGAPGKARLEMLSKRAFIVRLGDENRHVAG